MPKITQKQQIIEELEAKALASAAADNESINSDGEETLELLSLLCAVHSCRYLEERIHLAKSNMFENYMYIQGLENNRFCQEVRMNYNSFKTLLDLIKTNKMYQPSGTKPQVDIRTQAIVALERLGTYGNGTSVGKVARKAGISGKIFLKKNKKDYQFEVYVYRRISCEVHTKAHHRSSSRIGRNIFEMAYKSGEEHHQKRD